MHGPWVQLEATTHIAFVGQSASRKHWSGGPPESAPPSTPVVGPPSTAGLGPASTPEVPPALPAAPPVLAPALPPEPPAFALPPAAGGAGNGTIPSRGSRLGHWRA